jgi:hypothetical protein
MSQSVFRFLAYHLQVLFNSFFVTMFSEWQVGVFWAYPLIISTAFIKRAKALTAQKQEGEEHKQKCQHQENSASPFTEVHFLPPCIDCIFQLARSLIYKIDNLYNTAKLMPSLDVLKIPVKASNS